MKYICVIAICFSLIYCTSSQPKLLITEPNNESENRIVAYTTKKRGISFNEIRLSDVNFQDLPKEIEGLAFKDGDFRVISDSGTFCLTNIIDNNVTVRNFPSLESEIIYKLRKNDIIQIIGCSGENVNVDNFYGYWVNIIHQKNDNEYINGWVFSKYVNIKNREYTPIRFVDFETSKYTGEPLMRISHTLRGNEPFILSDWNSWNNYYILVWGPFKNHYHYSNKPGIYFLNKETFELTHITYLGSYEPTGHVWTVFTDDFKYLLQDSGTNAGIRGISAWRLKDLKLMFEGSYYTHDYNVPIISNNIIEIVMPYGDLYFEYGYTDEEIMTYGKKFEKENPIPKEMEERLKETTLGIELIIRCSFDLDTGERKILRGEYIYTQ